jgi:hypothetical protein
MSQAMRSRHQRAEPERILTTSKKVLVIFNSQRVMDMIENAMKLTGIFEDPNSLLRSRIGHLHTGRHGH